MKELLDDQYIPNDQSNKNDLTTNLQLRSNIYTIIMLIGGVLYFYHANPTHTTYQLIIASVILTLFCLFVSLVLELIRFWMRQRRAQKIGQQMVMDPLWFLIWEGGFSIWLILFFVILLSTLI